MKSKQVKSQQVPPGWHNRASLPYQMEALLLQMQPLLRTVLPAGQPVNWGEFIAAIYWSESRAFQVSGGWA